jgi:hypothetical protein
MASTLCLITALMLRQDGIISYNVLENASLEILPMA